MRILVTGGAGFIGSHLCERLVGEGHEVHCADNFSTGRIENVPRDVHIVRLDVAQLMSKIRIPRIDRIYHLACPASPKHYMDEPVSTIETNVHGTLAALNLARTTGARMLLASTSEIYGDPQVHPQPEGYFGNVNPNGPRACYDEGKRIAEALCCEFQREFSTDIRIARIFNTYGPRMAEDDGRVMTEFVCGIRDGKVLHVHGGDQTRSFCYVDDMVDGLVRLMEYDGEERHTPFNLGNPEEITIYQLMKEIGFLMGKGYDFTITETREDDPMQRRPDISKAMRLLGWEPEISLEDGLERTISYILDSHKEVA